MPLEPQSIKATAVNLRWVTVYFCKHGAGHRNTYAVVAGSAREAAILIFDHLDLRHRWERLDVTVLPREPVEGPPRVLGLVRGDDVKDGVKARR